MLDSYTTRTNVIGKDERIESGITVVHAIIKKASQSTFQAPRPNNPNSCSKFGPLFLPSDQYESYAAAQRLQFLSDCLEQASNPNQGEVQILIFLPSRAGHLVRSDILEIRLAGCPGIASYVNLVSPTKHFSEKDIPVSLELPTDELLNMCIGVAKMSKDPFGAIPKLDQELSMRFSLKMMQENLRPRRTLAILECGKSPASGAGIFSAAKALNIGVVALDKPGHWTSKDEYASWRDAFIPIDRTPDDGLADRIVAALQTYGKRVDGIVSFFDPLLSATAAAAATLGLPTAPTEAFKIATDKQLTSEFDGRTAYRVSSLEGALEVVHQKLNPSLSTTSGLQHAEDLSYPLIVKPCAGWGSEGVFRANNETELVRAVNSIDFDRHGSEFVIEKYCDGPEVDVNIVLCDNELLFFEVSDDLPKDADLSTPSPGGNSTQGTFIELANVLPSALPRNEQTLLKDSLCDTLRRLGFSSGFFHMEARVHNSRMRYGRNADGVIELEPKDISDTSQDPSTWLIEINARPPGLQAAWASRNTYGVDFWGLSLTLALDDKDTVRTLAAPFGTEHGNQYWCQIVFVPVPKGGVFQSDDVCKELGERRPDLAKHISRSLCFFERGQAVPDPSEGLLTWVAYYLVFSRESRQHVMALADEVMKETVFSIA